MPRKKMLFTFVFVGVGLIVLRVFGQWNALSHQFIFDWRLPMKRGTSNNLTIAQGNVCIVEHGSGASMPLACSDVTLFPHVYQAIGVDETRLSEWQARYGYDSGGIGSEGELLVPGYPVFSGLAWTLINPVYLKGEELSELLAEIQRISEQSHDPVVRANLRKLSTIAQKAQAESKVLRIA